MIMKPKSRLFPFVYSPFVKGCLKRGKAYATMSKVMGDSVSEAQGVSAWWKETARTRVFVLSCSLLLNQLKPQSWINQAKPNSYYS